MQLLLSLLVLTPKVLPWIAALTSFQPINQLSEAPQELGSFAELAMSCVPLGMEKACTTEARGWGLMGRTLLPPDRGMLFIFPEAQQLSFWMFNCYIDLSIAYIDAQHVIRGIDDLEAFPEAMDPSRPVHSLKDLKKYPQNDPTIAFFASKSRESSIKAKYALEVNKGWFKKNQIGIGDLVCWDASNDQGYISRAINLNHLLKGSPKLPLVFKLPESVFYAVWMPDSDETVLITFLDPEKSVINQETLHGGAKTPPALKPVVTSSAPAAYLLISASTRS